MANRWDAPPRPKLGDERDDTTYAGVGRVLSQWETVEHNLGLLYAIFDGHPQSRKAVLEYGAASIFTARVVQLRLKACAYFRKHPNQTLEGDFRAVCTAAEGFSNRRNEIAHGVVRKFWWNMPPPKRRPPATVGGANKHLHCLVPAAYMKRKFDADDRNVYAYASPQLTLIEQHLQALAMETLDLRAQLLKKRPTRT